jgi:hypothetical protein
MASLLGMSLMFGSQFKESLLQFLVVQPVYKLLSAKEIHTKICTSAYRKTYE